MNRLLTSGSLLAMPFLRTNAGAVGLFAKCHKQTFQHSFC